MGRPGGRRAKIAFFDAYALTEGAGLVLVELVQRMDRERFEPIALLPREGPLADRLVEVDCSVEVLAPPPPLNLYGQRLAGGGAADKLRAGVALARYSRRVARWLRGRGVDLLHCNQTRAAVQAGPAARLARVPMLWNVRIHERMPAPLVRLAEICSSLIVPLTESTFDGIATQQRLMKRSTIIRNAVDLDLFRCGHNGHALRESLGIEREAPVIVTAGVLVPRKGFDVLIRAMPEIRRRVPAARLLIAGGKPDMLDDCAEQLREMARELGLSDAVTLLGRRNDMPELLSCCDVFALTSRYEGDPAVVLEAMATSRPVIVTPDAAAAVQHGETGLIVPSDDPGAVADAVCNLLTQPELARRLGEAGRRQVEQHHDLRAMIRAYEDAWSSVLEEVT